MLQCFACLRDHISWAQLRAADMMAAEVLPPTEASWNGIKDVYLRKIYPIFPIFDKSRLESIRGPWYKDAPPLRRIDQLVVASVCHAVSLDREASPFLCFRTEPHKPVEQLLYRDTLVATITEFVVKQCDKKRYLFDYLRSMTLLCFFWQGTSFVPRPVSVLVFRIGTPLVRFLRRTAKQKFPSASQWLFFSMVSPSSCRTLEDADSQ